MPLATSFDWAIDITGLATVLLALATAYLALTTRSQATATGQQVGISQTQVARSHRPVLVPEQKNTKVRFRGGEVHALGLSSMPTHGIATTSPPTRM